MNWTIPLLKSKIKVPTESWKSVEKSFGLFPAWKKHVFWSVSMERGGNFPDYLLTCNLIILYSDIFYKIDILTLMVLTIIMPVFNLHMSFGKVKTGKSLEIYIETCVGTLQNAFIVFASCYWSWICLIFSWKLKHGFAASWKLEDNEVEKRFHHRKSKLLNECVLHVVCMKHCIVCRMFFFQKNQKCVKPFPRLIRWGDLLPTEAWCSSTSTQTRSPF